MPLLRTLLFTLLLPALLLPEGARFCLHELVCGADASCGCPQARPTPTRRPCCGSCRERATPPPATAPATTPTPRAELAAAEPTCCVALHAAPLMAPHDASTTATRALAHDAFAAATLPVPPLPPFAAPSDVDATAPPPLRRAAAPPPARARFVDARFVLPLRN